MGNYYRLIWTVKTDYFIFIYTVKSYYYIFIYTVKTDYFIYIYTRLPVTHWVKLSLNFELIVPK